METNDAQKRMIEQTDELLEAFDLPKYKDLLKLAERVGRLNRNAGEIGAGMLASLVDDARKALGER